MNSTTEIKMWLIYIWLTSLTFSSLMATDIILKSSTITHVIILNWNTVERTNQEHIQNKIIIFVSHCKCEVIIFVSHCREWSYYICFRLQGGLHILYLFYIAGWVIIYISLSWIFQLIAWHYLRLKLIHLRIWKT